MVQMAKTICEECEKVFMGGPDAFFCPKCLKKRMSEAAKKRNLSKTGRDAQKRKRGNGGGNGESSGNIHG